MPDIDEQPGPFTMIGLQGGGSDAPFGVLYQDEKTCNLVIQINEEFREPHRKGHFNYRWREADGEEFQVDDYSYHRILLKMRPLVQYTVKVQYCTQGSGPFPTDNCGPWSEASKVATWYGALIRFKSSNFRDLAIRHRNFFAEATPIASDLDQADSLFWVRRGLANPSLVSFESYNYPGYYLRHEDWRIKISNWDLKARNDVNALFNKDATFSFIPGLNGQDASFQSLNYPDRFIRHRDFHLFLDPTSSNPVSFNSDATWALQVI